MAARFARLRQWAQAIKRDVHAVYLASKDPRVPWGAKALGVCIVAYALSPIDLIPDFIPVLGHLDELILLPLALLLVIRMIPPEIMAEHRAIAATAAAAPHSTGGAIAILTIWVALTCLFGWLAYRSFSE